MVITVVLLGLTIIHRGATLAPDEAPHPLKFPQMHQWRQQKQFLFQRARQTLPSTPQEHSHGKHATRSPPPEKGGGTLQRALDLVLGPRPNNPTLASVHDDSAYWAQASDSNNGSRRVPFPASRVRRRCRGFWACEHVTFAVEVDNAVFHEGTLYLRDADPESRAVVEELRNFYQSLKGRKVPATEVYLPPARVLHVNGAKWVEGPPIKFLAPGEDIPGTANATTTTTASTAFSCQRHWNTSVFFLHPYFPDNSFHALNDNVFAVLASVALQHLTGAAAGAGDHRSLFLYRDRAPGGQSRRPTVMWRTLHTLFDDVRPARDVLAGGPHCVRHVAYAAALTTMHSHTLVVLRRALYLVMQAALRLLPSYPTLPAPELRFPDDNGRVHRASNESDRSRSSADRATQRTQPGQSQPPPPPRVVIITRNTTAMETLKKTIQRTLSRQSEHALRDAFVARGAAVAICCDWTIHNTLTKQLAFLGHADIVVGIHGAGLANAVFAPMGSVVVELQDYGWGDMLFGMLGHASGGDYVWVDMGDMPHETNDKRGIGAILPQQMVAAIVDAALKRHVAVRSRRATAATAAAAAGPAALIAGVDYSFRAAFAVDTGQPPATGTRNEAALLELLPSQPPGVQRMYVVQDPTAFGIDAALASGGGGAGGPPPGGWWPAPASRAVLGLWLRNASTVALCHRMPYYRLRRAIMGKDPQAQYCDDNYAFALDENLKHPHAFFAEFV